MAQSPAKAATQGISRFLMRMGFGFRAKAAEVPRLRTESPLLELSSGSSGSTGNAIIQSTISLGSTRAGGQDDGSYYNLLQISFGNNLTA